MSDLITDVWFRSELELEELADHLRLEDVEVDAENHWEWLIGTLMGERVDVTRTHTVPPGETDTCVFLLGRKRIPEALLAKLVSRLRTTVPGPIMAGRWEYLRGDDFAQVVVRTYDAPHQ